MSIYPPVIQNTQTAFPVGTNPYIIEFSSQYNTTFQHVQIRIAYQEDDSHVIGAWPDGIIYKQIKASPNVDTYSVSIDVPTDLSEGWKKGQLYRIQLRFGEASSIPPKGLAAAGEKSFSDWKQEQIQANAFSEWSTVTLVKAIDGVELSILNAGPEKENSITQYREATLTPEFIGQAISEYEMIETYEFNLYDKDMKLIESSGKQYHTGAEDKHRFKTILEPNEEYVVSYNVTTRNGYTPQVPAKYTFSAEEVYFGDLEDITLTVEDSAPYCRENGCINIYITSQELLTGSFVITRASEKTGYSKWEDLTYLLFVQEEVKNLLVFQDFTIESGVRYKYAFQQENVHGLRTSPIQSSSPSYVNFEYSYLYHDGIQLRIQFNQTMNSFKRTVLRNKQDTLGGKYPQLMQNGNANYAEFPLTGLISFQMDSDQTFFKFNEDGYYYKGELVIPADKFIIDFKSRDSNKLDNNPRISTDLVEDNIFVERIFREKVEEFLNDFNYKLYRSPTEGNIVVSLMNVTLTPEKTLGRMIFSFSATAYEVADNDIESLNNYGIINVGKFNFVPENIITKSFGQIKGIYGQNIDVYNEIRQIEEVPTSNEYIMKVQQITSIRIERYPNIDFISAILELEGNRSERPELAEEINQQIKELEGIREALSVYPTSTQLKINGRYVMIQPDHIYTLNEPITELRIEKSQPIIIDYICDMAQVYDDTVKIVSAIDVTREWGQLAGIFTDTDEVLKVYDQDYVRSKYVKISDDANFDVYKTLNIYKAIREEAIRNVGNANGVTFTRSGLEETYSAGDISIQFGNLTYFDIEADENTILYIGKAADGSDKQAVKVGPTGRYAIELSGNMINYIALQKPQFAVVNYKCDIMAITKKAYSKGA